MTKNTTEKRLSDVHSGFAIIERIEGGKNSREKLISMGLLPGKKVEILSGASTGPMIIKVHDTRIALGHGLAHKIFVKS